MDYVLFLANNKTKRFERKPHKQQKTLLGRSLSQLPLPNRPWDQKFRSLSLEELVSQKDLVSILQSRIGQTTPLAPHAMILYGQDASELDWLAGAFVHDYFPEIEGGLDEEGKIRGIFLKRINGAIERGPDTARALGVFAVTESPIPDVPKMVVLDLVDCVVRDSQLILAGIIEKSSRNTVFLMTAKNLSDITL